MRRILMVLAGGMLLASAAVAFGQDAASFDAKYNAVLSKLQSMGHGYYSTEEWAQIDQSIQELMADAARREADTDVATILGIAGSADESLIDALLRLLAQIVVNAGDDDDELVASVGGACYQAGVVGRLARLHHLNGCDHGSGGAAIDDDIGLVHARLGVGA